MLNSFYISFIVALYSIIMGGIAVYSISRFRTGLNSSLYPVFLSSRILPAMGMIIPFFIIFRQLKLINTHRVLIPSCNLFILPLSIWLLEAYLDKVPPYVEEMSLINGQGRFGPC
jgi:multiple sugar transport system permease protein